MGSLQPFEICLEYTQAAWLVEEKTINRLAPDSASLVHELNIRAD
jgi:hypothetical protein